jgi:hypothetical protein
MIYNNLIEMGMWNCKELLTGLMSLKCLQKSLHRRVQSGLNVLLLERWPLKVHPASPSPGSPALHSYLIHLPAVPNQMLYVTPSLLAQPHQPQLLKARNIEPVCPNLRQNHLFQLRQTSEKSINFQAQINI